MRPIVPTIKLALLSFFFIGFAQNVVAQCGYDVTLSTEDMVIRGNIFNTSTAGPDYPQKINWYLSSNGQIFSNETFFELETTSYGECSICADYEVTQTDGTKCSEIICRTVNVVDPALSCTASFSFTDYIGPMPILGGITFSNFSTGPYTDLRWDFGDGIQDLESKETVTHIYSETGSYEVTLSIWEGAAQDCYTEFTQTVDVYIADNPCDQLDCVWPGDTDADGKATLKDLINIGVGFGMTGPERENITSTWEGQAAQDWDLENGEGINYKHFDCNGDGEININDIPAIQSNYVMLENSTPNTYENGVPVSLSFDVDTIVVTEENQYLEINAGLNIGDTDNPMKDVYGMVLYLTYQKNYVAESGGVTFKYNENSFLGDASSVIPIARNIPERGQTDLAMARRVPTNASGIGRIASLKFIIESDIIDGRAENDGESFIVHINVVTAVDINGNEIELSISDEPASVFFQNGITTTSIAAPLLDDSKIEVYPNPVNDLLQVEITDDLHPQSIEVFNALGQRMIFTEMNEVHAGINVSRLPMGVYMLKVQTEEGIGTKRIMIER